MRTVQHKVEVYSITDALISIGVLVDLDGDYMEIIGDIFPRFEKGEKLKICAYDDMRGICWYTAVVDYSVSDRIQLTDVELLNVIQRRQNIKVKTTFTTQIFNIYDDDDNMITLDEPINIQVKDISVGGVFFVCDMPFKENQKIEFFFNQGPRPLRIKTSILRRQEVNGQNNGYGCIYDDLTEREQDILFSYIWEVQRQQLRRMKTN